MSFKIQILKMLFDFNLLIAVQLFLIVLCDGHPFRFYTQRTARNVPSMVPLGMFPDGNSKNPLVAATYYFNPQSSSIQGPRQETVYVSGVSNSNDHHSNYNSNSDSPGSEPDLCKAPDGRNGICYEASECVSRGGMPMGRCDSSPTSGIGSGPSGQAKTNVCCLFEVTCGDSAQEKFVYFRNPQFPNWYDRAKMCRTKIGKIHSNICQFKVDFRTFDVARPIEGNCSQDIFVVSGQNENDIVPKICGLNNGQHYYFGVDESGVISFNVMMLGNHQRRFDISINQIECNKENAAPPHCLQYYQGTHGSIKSFNYDYNQIDGNTFQEGYPNDIDYMMCIKKEAGFCSITYELLSDSEGVMPFAIGSGADVGQGQSSWPVIAECRDDYIVIGGMRLCSGNAKQTPDGVSAGVNEPSNDSGLTRLTGRQGFVSNNTIHKTVITDSTPGPFMIRFVSNHGKNAKGFHIGFRQNPCK